MSSSTARFDEAEGLLLPLGGKHGYAGVRGGQGRGKDKFQGHTPKKSKEHFDAAL